MKRPDEVTEYLRCGGANCDGACNTQLDKLGVEDCLTWRVHGYVQQLEGRVVHLESLNQQNLSMITMQERTRARLEEQISQLETHVPRWISVEERLPGYDELVLCVGAKGGMFLGCKLRLFAGDKTAYCFVPNARNGRYAKYWMPLPEPPKEVEHP